MPTLRLRSGIAPLLAAGSALAQPPSVSYELSWRAIPSGGQMLLLGDSAEVKLLARVYPPVGTVVSDPSLPGGGTGTVAGLASIYFDLRGCQSNGGTWTLSGTGFTGTTGNTWGVRSGWDFGNPGVPQTNGDVLYANAGQFIFPGGTANATNPVAEIWRGKWSPSSWATTTYRWEVSPIESDILVRVAVNGNVYYAALHAQGIPSSFNAMIDPGNPGPCWPNWNPPQDTTAFLGHAATFHMSASIGGTCLPITYQWRMGCTNLVDDGRITGVFTPDLRIDPVLPSDAGTYNCRFWGGLLFGGPAWLRIACYANCDSSTAAPTLNVNDFQCFLNKFAAGDSYANCDGSTTPPILNANDFQCFLNEFSAGCS